MTSTRSTTPENSALWMRRPGAKLEVSPTAYTPPAAEEVVVRVHAVAVNLIDTIPRIAYRVILPWLTFPTVIGSDLAGEVVEVGLDVTRLRVGDRVLAHAVGTEKSRNRPAEGAFQTSVVLMEHMVAPIPDTLSYAQACVLPLALSTAACGLFQSDQLGLVLPSANPAPRNETVLVWGASTSVGINAVQLARNAGYRVIATASPRNFDWVRSLGADEVIDRTSATAVKDLVNTIDASPLAGILAIGAGSLAPSITIAALVPGAKRVASAHPTPVTKLRARLAKRRGVHVSAIWGATLKDNEVGPAIYRDFLPTSLATGVYTTAPAATVVGEGLATIPLALERLKGGISAEKLVVTL